MYAFLCLLIFEPCFTLSFSKPNQKHCTNPVKCLELNSAKSCWFPAPGLWIIQYRWRWKGMDEGVKIQAWDTNKLDVRVSEKAEAATETAPRGGYLAGDGTILKWADWRKAGEATSGHWGKQPWRITSLLELFPLFLSSDFFTFLYPCTEAIFLSAKAEGMFLQSFTFFWTLTIEENILLVCWWWPLLVASTTP